MGASVLSTLLDLRTSISTTLNNAGIKAVEYVQENVVPPVCVVVPGDPYISVDSELNKFGQYEVTFSVLVIGGKGTNKSAADKLDLTIVNVVDTLDVDWEVTEVSAPQEMTLKGLPFLGVVVTLKTNTKLIKEVM